MQFSIITYTHTRKQKNGLKIEHFIFQELVQKPPRLKTQPSELSRPEKAYCSVQAIQVKSNKMEYIFINNRTAYLN